MFLKTCLVTGVIMVIGIGCGNAIVEQKGSGNTSSPSPGEIYNQDRVKAIEVELENWYREAGISEEKLREFEEEYDEMVHEFEFGEYAYFFSANWFNREYIKFKFQNIYGEAHPKEEAFLELYFAMEEARMDVESHQDEELLAEDPGYYYSWEKFLVELEKVLVDYTDQFRELLGAEFGKGFGRLGENGNLFSVLRLDPNTKIEFEDEAGSWLLAYDLIPNCVWVTNCIPDEVWDIFYAR